jgi:predicted ATPase
MVKPIPWINRVRLTDYKSIASCDVSLGPLTVLIGPNGTGKSNFLDALSFVSDALTTTPAQAIEARGGLSEILRRVPESTDSFRIDLEVTVPWGASPEQWAHGIYGFRIARKEQRGRRPFEVAHEECDLTWAASPPEGFRVEAGAVSDSLMFHRSGQAIEPDRLYLPLAGARPSLAPLFRALRGMEFYNFESQSLRQLQPQSEGAPLGRGGEHLGDVLGAIAEEHPDIKERIDSYLGAVAPWLASVDRRFEGNYVTVEVRNRTGPGGSSVVFGPESVSEGTIRATAVLAALFQPTALDGRTSLVGIEEPEAALHPAAAGVLFDALTEASEHVQVITTTQSDDLVDRDDLDPAIIRAVSSDMGLTVIGEINAASLRALREHRFTAGELMRAGQIAPDMPINPGDADVAVR